MSILDPHSESPSDRPNITILSDRLGIRASDSSSIQSFGDFTSEATFTNDPAVREAFNKRTHSTDLEEAINLVDRELIVIALAVSYFLARQLDVKDGLTLIHTINTPKAAESQSTNSRTEAKIESAELTITIREQVVEVNEAKCTVSQLIEISSGMTFSLARVGDAAPTFRIEKADKLLGEFAFSPTKASSSLQTYNELCAKFDSVIASRPNDYPPLFEADELVKLFNAIRLQNSTSVSSLPVPLLEQKIQILQNKIEIVTLGKRMLGFYWTEEPRLSPAEKLQLLLAVCDFPSEKNFRSAIRDFFLRKVIEISFKVPMSFSNIYEGFFTEDPNNIRYNLIPKIIAALLISKQDIKYACETPEQRTADIVKAAEIAKLMS